MTMTPRLRKLALTAHITASVGWLGAVAAFLALAVVGLVGTDGPTVRGAYLAAAVVTWFVIVPLCLASLLTGIVQSLGTTWGLIRHYWVVVKLALTVGATLLLFVHTQPIDHLAATASDAREFGDDLHGMRVQLVVDAGLAIVVLLVTTALSTVKPLGQTRYWQRRVRGSAAVNSYARPPSTP